MTTMPLKDLQDIVLRDRSSAKERHKALAAIAMRMWVDGYDKGHQAALDAVAAKLPRRVAA